MFDQNMWTTRRNSAHGNEHRRLPNFLRHRVTSIKAVMLIMNTSTGFIEQEFF